MSHDLSFYEGKAELMYVRGETPWHGFGTPVDGAVKAAEAIEAAHLGWTVEKRELFYPDNDGKFIRAQIGGARLERDLPAFVTVRTDTGRALGIVSEQYKVVQNVESFVWLDELLGTALRYETAGALFGGRRVWMLGRIPAPVFVGDDETDPIERYILFVNGHDGAKAVSCIVTPVRVVCNNTLNAALDMAGRDSGITICHTGDIDSKLDAARAALAAADKQFAQMYEYFRMFSEVRLDEAEMLRYFNLVFPEDRVTERQHVRETARLLEITRIGAGSELPTAKGTLWGAYNAVTDYVDHVRGTTDGEQRMNSVLMGSGARIKTRAFMIACSVTDYGIEGTEKPDEAAAEGDDE